MAPVQHNQNTKDTDYKNCKSLMDVNNVDFRAFKKYADCDQKRSAPCRILNIKHPNKLQ